MTESGQKKKIPDVSISLSGVYFRERKEAKKAVSQALLFVAFYFHVFRLVYAVAAFFLLLLLLFLLPSDLY